MVKTLNISLGEVRGLSLAGIDPIVGQQLAVSGWYYDPITGKQYYYDATLNQWYSVSAEGFLYALSIDILPTPKQIAVGAGDTVKISISYKYIGPAVTGVKEKFVIGHITLGALYEDIIKEPTRNLLQTTTPVTYTQTQDLLIPSAVQNNWRVIECKVHGGSPSVGEFGVRYENALVIGGVQPNITEFAITDYYKKV